MDKKRKIGFATKFLSSRMYLNEVSVEGKTSNKFNFNIAYYNLYAAQIIRNGNCITLLSNTIPINKEHFWNTNYFEDLTKFVFWTFNKSFRLTLIDSIHNLLPTTLLRCAELLQENFTPYDEKLEEQADEELYWCLVKNGNLKKDPDFDQMYLIDKESRTAILEALRQKIASFETKEDKPAIIPSANTTTEIKATSFADMLRPINGSSQETLDFMISKWAEAEFELNIFSTVAKYANGKNAYGLNGAIAAMIDFFWQYNYFKKGYTMEEVFKAYSAYTGNSIAKLKTFFSTFREDNSYIKHFNKLKQLKINKLK